MHDLLDLLPVGAFVIDEEQTIETLNPAAAALLGYEPAQLSGRRCGDVLRCSHCNPACAAMEARATERPYVGFPTQLTNAKGKKRSILMDAVPLGSGRVAVLLRDVTDTGRVPEAAVAARPEDRMRAALGRTGGCVTRAARLLGIHRTTLWRQMREAGLSRDDFLVG